MHKHIHTIATKNASMLPQMSDLFVSHYAALPWLTPHITACNQEDVSVRPLP